MQLYTMFVEKTDCQTENKICASAGVFLSVGVLLPVSAGNLLFIFALCKYCCQVKKDRFSKGD